MYRHPFMADYLSIVCFETALVPRFVRIYTIHSE